MIIQHKADESFLDELGNCLETMAALGACSTAQHHATKRLFSLLKLDPETAPAQFIVAFRGRTLLLEALPILGAPLEYSVKELDVHFF